MEEVKFYDTVDDSLLKFAVIVAKCDGKWVLCKHKERDTYEAAGGHREKGEKIIETAKRELYEETGAVEYDLIPVCIYSVSGKDEETYGMLYYADIRILGELPQFEIEKVYLFEDLPSDWTYPHIQPKLINKVKEQIFRKAEERFSY
ncbi:MAG TPA: DNA mismatch repair protein MutT [Clostridiales bacterium]|nr:DNA mismatch repair protein MutT [Clostridiales bacterium]